MPKTIIVPLDGSEFAERALAPARALAQRTGAPVVLMTSRIGGPQEPDAYLAETARRAGIASPKAVVISDRGAVGGLAILVSEATDAVVCMSTHGRSGAGHALLGSVAEEAIRLIPSPFLLVGPAVEAELATRFDTVVVCIDGSDFSNAILAPASDWIRRLRLRAWVVQVLDPEASREPPDQPERVIEESHVYSVAQALLHHDGGGVNWDVLHGEQAAEPIVDYASRLPASLIALATHGRSGIARFALGSVAASVVHAARCPVLVVRPDGARAEGKNAAPDWVRAGR